MNKISTTCRTCLRAALLLCLTAGFLASCKDDRQDTGWKNQSFTMDADLARTSRDSVDFILKKSMERNPRFSTFAANLDIKVGLEGHTIGFGGQLRVQNGQIIWISCQKLVFEIFRAKITPDTVAFYSKIAGMASVYADDSLKDLVPKSFGLLQALFLRSADSVMFQGERSLGSEAENWIVQGVSGDSLAWQLYIGKEDFRPSGIGIQIGQDTSVLQIAVAYQNDNGFTITVSEDRKLLVSARISYSKPRWNENISFPFAIPAGIETEYGHGMLNNLKKSRDNGLMMD
ncbi:MAG: DUF4292 domain-containing protein [Bacteroidales bacterium]|nr:DUF4292 domain-containing protein [Bacteroidales bacterium]